MAGKAHPRDEGGKALIHEIHGHMRQLAGEIPMAFLPNYDMALAKPLVAGADVWLNTPLPPLEASGTSGMKAALNGVLEPERARRLVDRGLRRGRNRLGDRPRWRPRGTATTPGTSTTSSRATVLPLYHGDRGRWIWMMKQAISKIGSLLQQPAHDAALRERSLSPVMPDPGIGMTFRRRRAKGRVKAMMAARSEIRTHQGSVRVRSTRTCSGGGIAAHHDVGIAALLEVRIEDRFAGRAPAPPGYLGESAILH